MMDDLRQRAKDDADSAAWRRRVAAAREKQEANMHRANVRRSMAVAIQTVLLTHDIDVTGDRGVANDIALSILDGNVPYVEVRL